MEVTTESADGALIAKAGGRIDGTNAGDFESAMQAAFTDSSDAVVLDCEELTYISSAGLRAILRIAKDLNRRTVKFMLCALSDPIREVFQISGFDKIITIHDTRSGALEAHCLVGAALAGRPRRPPTQPPHHDDRVIGGVYDKAAANVVGAALGRPLLAARAAPPCRPAQNEPRCRASRPTDPATPCPRSRVRPRTPSLRRFLRRHGRAATSPRRA